jgi:hypothetical protein
MRKLTKEFYKIRSEIFAEKLEKLEMENKILRSLPVIDKNTATVFMTAVEKTTESMVQATCALERLLSKVR